jgi:hypothetical protein
LAMSSSVKNRFNECAHAVHRHAQHDHITVSKFMPRSRQAAAAVPSRPTPPADAGDRRRRQDHRFAGATRCDLDRRGGKTMRMSDHWLRK